MNIITNTVLLRGLVSSTLSACDKRKEKAEERERFGPDIIRPKEPSSSIGDEDPYTAWSSPVTENDCLMLRRIWSDMQEGTLKTSDKYGLKVSSPFGTFFELEKTFSLGKNGMTFFTDVTARIAMTLAETMSERDKEKNIQQELKQLSYFSVLKSLSPVLLGLGIGIRLARTHYDVKTEERKAKTQIANA
jgi:hypothetical protein